MNLGNREELDYIDIVRDIIELVTRNYCEYMIP